MRANGVTTALPEMGGTELMSQTPPMPQAGPPMAIASVLAVACAFLVLTAGTADAQRRGGRASAGAPAVTIAEVQVVPINERIAAVGSGRARRQVTVATRHAGVVANVMFEGGKMVEANQPLVQLHAETEQIAVETAEAQRARRSAASATFNAVSASARATLVTTPSVSCFRRSTASAACARCASAVSTAICSVSACNCTSG